jgi:hypothetical protein
MDCQIVKIDNDLLEDVLADTTGERTEKLFGSVAAMKEQLDVQLSRKRLEESLPRGRTRIWDPEPEDSYNVAAAKRRMRREEERGTVN